MSGPELERSAALVNPHHCFGCGELNRHGLHLRFAPDPDGNGVFALFCPPPRVEGYPGVVHGGILATVLDEVMAWSLYRHDIWAVTGALTTRFRQPVRIGEETQAVGYLLRDRRRVLEMRGEIRRLADGTLLAEATATFVRVSKDQEHAWHQRYQGSPSGISGQGSG
ncbi:MAG TPA: PaaI family thioesterase [Thermomicrobiales bacterium]|nr:PaaI family thioesterase [Thermomicrobiales bacterium]